MSNDDQKQLSREPARAGGIPLGTDQKIPVPSSAMLVMPLFIFAIVHQLILVIALNFSITEHYFFSSNDFSSNKFLPFSVILTVSPQVVCAPPLPALPLKLSAPRSSEHSYCTVLILTVSPQVVCAAPLPALPLKLSAPRGRFAPPRLLLQPGSRVQVHRNS